MMWQAGNPALDALTVNHYLEIGTAGLLGVTAYLCKMMWADLKARVDDHGERITELEVVTGMKPERRRAIQQGEGT